MFKPKNKFENIFKYHPFDNEKILISKHSNYKNPYICLTSIDTKKEEDIIKTDIVIDEFLTTQQGIIIKDNNNFSRIYKNNSFLTVNQEVESIKIKFPIEYENFLICYKGKVKERQYGFFNIFGGIVEWLNYNFSNVEIIKNNLIGKVEDNLLFFELPETNKLWQFNISTIEENSKTTRLIGTYQNILIAGISTDWLIGIDTETGKLVWKIKTIPKFDIIDNEKGVLHSITSGYVKTDILTGKILDLFDDKSYFEKKIGIESQRNNYVIVEDHLITTDWRKGKIGAFNTKTHKFDWMHEEPGISFPGGQTIKYFEPYLFVMDNKQALHIFEKV